MKNDKIINKSKIIKASKGFPFSSGSMDFIFLALVLILLIYGLIMLYSASYANAYYYQGDSAFYIKKQLLYAFGGVLGLFAVSKFDISILQKIPFFKWGLLGGSFALLILVFAFQTEEKGVSRWIDLGFFQFQPSEIAKFALIVAFAILMDKNAKYAKTFKKGLLPFGFLLAIYVVPVLLGRHLSATLIMCFIAFFMMVIWGIHYIWVAAGTATGVAAVYFLILSEIVPWSTDRVKMWRDPFAYPTTEGFQTIQSLYAIATGGLFGTGIGNSRQKYMYIPEPQNDFIFAIICEETGIIGAIFIITLFALLIWRGFIIAGKTTDIFKRMVIIGIMLQVACQAFLNMSVVSNLIPNTGISLPFFSYGGTALIILMCEMGVVLSISRQANMEKV